MINDMDFTPEISREPDPTRLLMAYDKSASTLKSYCVLSLVGVWLI